MKEWLTAREIAAEALPDMPATESAVIRKIKLEGWMEHPSFARGRGGRGGGMEYNVSLLPPLAQVAYRQKHMVVAKPEKVAAPIVAGEILTDRAAKERDARLAILQAYARFTRGLGLGHATHVQVFTDRYNIGSLVIDGWVREIVPSLSKRTFARWQKAKRDGCTDRLAHDPSQSRKGTGVLETANDGKVAAFMLALIAQQPHLSAHHVRTLCRSEFGDTLNLNSKVVEMPPVRTFQHTLKGLKESRKVELVKLTNPDLYRSTLAPSGVGMLRHVTEPNQLWQIDASPVDALCTDGRHAIYACIDIATRRTIWLLSRTPRASAVALLIRKAVLAWGVPDEIKTDNGSDFVAQDTRRLFASLDIEMDLSEAYSPEQKGHVERVIGTFQREVGPLLPGFVGHSVADRKAIENRKSFAKRLGESEAETFGVSLTGPQLQKHVDEWAELVYQHRPHAGLHEKTPHQAALASSRPIRTVDVRALDLLLMPIAGSDGQRIVTKFGIRIDGYQYMTPSVLPGTAVLVRQDPNDLGRAYAFAQDGGEFLGDATCPELAGIHPQNFVQAAKEIRGDLMDERTRQMKAGMKELAKGPAFIERVLDVARRDNEKRIAEAANVIQLPKREIEHTTPQISAAIDAMDRHRSPPRELTAREQAEQARLIDEMSSQEITAIHEAAEAVVQTRLLEIENARVAHIAGRPNVVALKETPKERYRRAMLFEEQVRNETCRTADAVWLGGYQLSPEYRTHKEFHAAYGDEWLEN